MFGANGLSAIDLIHAWMCVGRNRSSCTSPNVTEPMAWSTLLTVPGAHTWVGDHRSKNCLNVSFPVVFACSPRATDLRCCLRPSRCEAGRAFLAVLVCPPRVYRLPWPLRALGSCRR